MYGFNESSLPTNTKFNLQEVKWNPKGISNKAMGGVISGNEGVFEKVGEIFKSNATISESYQSQADAPLYAVDGNIPINDSGNIRQKTITLTGLTSNSSMSIIDSLANLPEILASSALGQQFSSQLTRVEKAYNQLTKWHEEGTPLFLKTAYEQYGYRDIYGDIAPFKIISLIIPRDSETGDAITYTMTLQQVFIARVATSRTSDILIKFKGEKSSTSLGRNEELLPTDAQQNNKELYDISKEDVQGNDASAGNYGEQAFEAPK